MIHPETMQYQIVFCDIDGTLLDSNHCISSGTKEKIQELDSIGIPFILISARMPSAIFSVQRELGIRAPIVCYSGALILDEHGERIYTLGIDREKAVQIDDFVKKNYQQICCSTYFYNHWFSDNIQDKWMVQEQSITSCVPKEGKIPEFVPQAGQVHKLLCMGEASEIEDLGHALIKEFSGLSVYRSKSTYLEIMNGAVLKSRAVTCLCDYYGVPIETAVSFGDNFNDLDMLLATGTSFAMGNAPEEVKRQARNITLDNDHEGVLEGLKQLNFAKKHI